jgi:hypothetical protein
VRPRRSSGWVGFPCNAAQRCFPLAGYFASPSLKIFLFPLLVACALVRPFFSVELRVRFRPPVLWLWNYRVIFKNSGSVLSKFSGREWS